MKKIIKSKFSKGRYDVIFEDGMIHDIFFGKFKIPKYEKYYNAKFVTQFKDQKEG